MTLIHGDTSRWRLARFNDKHGAPLSKGMRRALRYGAADRDGLVYGGCAKGVTNATIEALHRRGLVDAEVTTQRMIRWTRHGNSGSVYFTEISGYLTDAGRVVTALEED